MAALAKDTTLKSILDGLTGAVPQRTAVVESISFDPAQFEAGKIDNSTGVNVSGSGFYRTSGYIELPENPWVGQLSADKPWNVYILYYDENKDYANEYDLNYTGYSKLKNYPYCRIYFYEQTSFMSTNDFITNRLKIQYIMNAPAENEYFLHNHLFNGNFEYDRNNDGIGDGWILKNNPSSYSISENTQIITPSAANYFLQFESDGRLTGHLIYVSFTANAPSGDVVLSVYGSNVTVAQNTKYTRASQNITAQNSGPSPRFTIASSGVSHPVYIRNVMLIDLTEVYGAGNEPTSSEVDEIIDKMYGGYVSSEFVVKYDDSQIPADVLTHLQNIETGADEIVFANGMVSAIKHHEGTQQKTITVNRDMFGNIVSIGGV